MFFEGFLGVIKMHNPVNRAPCIHHGDCSAIFTMVTVAMNMAVGDEREGQQCAVSAEGRGKSENQTCICLKWFQSMRS